MVELTAVDGRENHRSAYKHAHFYICTFHALKMNCIKTQCYLEIKEQPVIFVYCIRRQIFIRV